MIYQKLPRTDLAISPLILGTWAFGGDSWGGGDEKDCIEAVHKALDSGINCIDTAPIYSNGVSEEIVGRAIRKKDRSKIVLATKCGICVSKDGIAHDLSKERISQEIEESLRRLQTDYIDLYQCHWPDEKHSLVETFETLKALQAQGKIRYIGVSNYSPDLMDQALEIVDIVTSQDQYSLLDRKIEEKQLPYLIKKEISEISYGPLAGGILSGKYDKEPQLARSDARKYFYQYYKGDAFKHVTRLLDQLRELNKPLNEVAINWVRAQKGVTAVLVGCRTARQVEKNVQSLSWDLTAQQLAKIEEVQSVVSK